MPEWRVDLVQPLVRFGGLLTNYPQSLLVHVVLCENAVRLPKSFWTSRRVMEGKEKGGGDETVSHP